MKLFQIYYDENTRKKINPLCIPLLKENKSDGWYEFTPILNYLNENKIEENCFYGFLSPNFENKFGLSIKEVLQRIGNFHNYDVIILSPYWDLIAYYINTFEQAESCHSGIVDHTQKFLDHYSLNINIKNIIGSSVAAGYSNYIIAKKIYWDEWRSLANLYYNYSSTFPNQSFLTKHREEFIPINVFVQERFVNIILTSLGKFKVAALHSKNLSHNAFRASPAISLKYLQQCDQLKIKFNDTGNKQYLDQFLLTRQALTQELVSRHPELFVRSSAAQARKRPIK